MRTTTHIDNNDDVIDSRQVIDRIEELELIREAMPNAVEDWPGADEAEELATLQALADEASQYSEDWQYGVSLIRRSAWVEVCKMLLEDCGGIPKDLPHYVVIDWEATAENMEADYTSVDFGGVEYLIR
jgi:hypothetical protein